MKKKLALLLCAALVLALAVSCKPKTPVTPDVSGSGAASSVLPPDAPEPDGRPQVNLTLLSGPTGVGAAKLMADNDAGTTFNRYNVTVAAANDEVTASLLKGESDVAALATNVAANLAAKSDGAVRLLAVNTLGVLYLLEKGDTVHSVADLAGKTLYATGQGANPEFVLNHLLRKSDVDPADVDIQWLSAQEVSAKMLAADAGVCMLPVPAATALLDKDAQVRQAVSLSEAWSDLTGEALLMGCVVARTEWIEEHPLAVADFLAEYESSIQYISDPLNLTDASRLVSKYGISPNQKIAAAAIPQCNLTFMTGVEMRDLLSAYYEVLFHADPASIGGFMPYDSFYYGAD